MESFAAESMNDDLYLPHLNLNEQDLDVDVLSGKEPLVALDGIAFENTSETLLLDEVELRLDFNLDDDDLEVSLLVESLEQQYQDMLASAGEDSDAFLSLQSAKEWVNTNRDRMAGLFRYLKSLSEDQL